ncbi:Reverse transcriptase RNA-dependent DNA polymerase [Penicillium freii]|nr:Reverse transcriptase RNA-dependent DNA polymerase [Penicillium freii]
MQNAKPIATPFNEKDPLVLNPSPTPATPDTCKLYQEKVGKIIWLMVTTRADISYAAIQLAKHARNPGQQHEQALKRLFRYLPPGFSPDLTPDRSSSTGYDRCISSSTGYDRCISSQQLQLHGYCDTDYVGPHSTNGLSTSGFVFHLAGGPISWASKKQACVALSSTESEYIAQALAVQEARWLILLLTELHMHDSKYALLDKPVVINADNTGAIALAKNPEYHARTKHIAVRYHFLRQEISSSSVALQYVATQQQAADGLTKPLGTTAFHRFVDQLGLRPSSALRKH